MLKNSYTVKEIHHSKGGRNAGNVVPFKDSYGVLLTWFDPEEVFRLIEKYRATNFIGVPTMYQIMLHHPAAEIAGG